jgi:hypothetical protein
MDEFEKLQGDLARETEAYYEKQKAAPRSIRTGPGATLQTVAEQLGLQAFRRVTNGRWYAVDAEGRLELAALTVAARQSRRSLTSVIEAIAHVVPGWLQERPAEGAGTIPPLPVDKATGLRVRNPFLPLPPRPGETTPHFDHGSQNVIKEQSPRLAKWLQDCAKNDGLPSAKMLDELEAEKIEADHLRKIPYTDREWEANLLRPGSGANGTQQAEFVHSIADPWLLKFHRQEAKAASPRAGFDNLTHRMLLAKRDPEAREVHKAAGELLKTWQAEAQQKAAA